MKCQGASMFLYDTPASGDRSVSISTEAFGGFTCSGEFTWILG